MNEYSSGPIEMEHSGSWNGNEQNVVFISVSVLSIVTIF